MQPCTTSLLLASDRAGTRNTRHAYELSAWTRSRAKRTMDLVLVLIFLPIVVLILAIISLAVLLTSGTPILFWQERVGRNGVPFIIYKFRTMRPALVRPSSAIASQSANRITWFGAILRKSKLDELPQIFNVLSGDMSLVGPRPKVAEQELEPMACRPGMTGAATLAFAREEVVLQGLAAEEVDEYFHKTILLTKKLLDADYLRIATAWSDLQIVVKTVMGKWDSATCETTSLDDVERHFEASNQAAAVTQ